MFSDTHFHFKMMTEERGIDGPETLKIMAERNCFFGLDIGTRCDDLQGRFECVERNLEKIKSKSN